MDTKINFTLSIVVAVKGGANPSEFLETIAAGLLVREDWSEQVEIQMACDEMPDKYLFEDYPGHIEFHDFGPEASILQLWGRGLAQARGRYVAVMDATCPPREKWLKFAFGEINSNNKLFFGPVDCGWSWRDSRILGYLVEYAQFCSPLNETLNEVPGNNVVFLRDFLTDKKNLSRKGFFKTFMIWYLAKERKIIPRKVNGLGIVYNKKYSFFSYVKRRFVHGRCFGATRHDNAGQPYKLACIAFTMFLPALRVWRIFVAIKNRTQLRKAYFFFFVPIVISEMSWSFGEFLGYFIGGRFCCNKLD